MSRRRDDDRSPVEFVDAAGEPDGVAPGDELTTPPARHGRRYLVLSAAVLVGAALLAGRVRQQDPKHAPAPAPPTAGASASAAPSVDPAQCPGPTPCAASGAVPEAVAAAVLEAFPSARLGMSSTVYLQAGGLWFREINARAGVLDILVRIERPDRGTPVSQTGQGEGVTFVRQIEHGFLIQVQVEGPRNQLPSITNLYGLVDDERLLDLS